MSFVCQYTIMSPTASSSPASQMSFRLNQRRNALPDVHAGISTADINLIRVGAPACLNTASPTCVSTTTSSTTSRSLSSSSSNIAMGGSSEASASGLSQLAYQSPSSPLQSPNLRNRRNAMPDVLAQVDQGSLSRIRAASQASLSSHDGEEDDHHDHQFVF